MKMKPRIEPKPSAMKKQKRSKLPRRARPQLSPIIFLEDSSFGDDVSCDSSRVTVESSFRKRKSTGEIGPFDRKITRSRYCDEVQGSESVNESCSSRKTVEDENRAPETQLSEISRNDAVSVVDESGVVEQKKCSSSSKSSRPESDLACAERFCFDDDVVSEHSSSHEMALTELQSEIFPDTSSELDFSDYTPSIFLDSGSEFSERSAGDDSPASPTHCLLLEFRQQFSRSSASLLDASRASSLVGEGRIDNLAFGRFEDEEEEESYQRLRERERREVFVHDYVEVYRSTTDYGELISQQRSQMVHWIVEHSGSKEFQQETIFLGISLLDRFLCKGFFKSRRNLQIAGIACLTLATRIEENQPYNIVKQKHFYVGNNVYSRCEVVAMEWLVQEVLSFQCFLPTIYNFMWFYLKAARVDAEVEKRARYLAVLALAVHDQLGHWPSTVAAGLVILASLESNQISSYEQVIKVHVRTTENDLHECIKRLEWLLQYVS